jgi:hypothetical protein
MINYQDMQDEEIFAWIFTYLRVSASSVQCVFSRIYSLIDEDINPQISQIRTDLPIGGKS